MWGIFQDTLVLLHKIATIFFLWHVSSSRARDMEKLNQRVAAQDWKNGRLMPALRTPLDTSASEIIPSIFTVTCKHVPCYQSVKSLYFQGVIWLITLTSSYYLPRPFNAVYKASIPKVIRCNTMPSWDFPAWARAVAQQRPQLPVEPPEKRGKWRCLLLSRH